MKKFALILLLAISAASCAVKDKNAPVADPDYNRFFHIVQSQIYSTATTIWAESVLDFSASGAVVSRYGLCCNPVRTPDIGDYVADLKYGASGPVVITGLSPNTNYLCRAFFVTSDGSAYYSELFEISTQSLLSLELDGYPTSNTKDGGYVKAVLKEGSFDGCTERGFQSILVSSNINSCTSTCTYAS